MNPIFQLALQKADSPPEETSFSGDSSLVSTAALADQLEQISKQLVSLDADIGEQRGQEDLAQKAAALYTARRKCDNLSDYAPMPNTPGFDIMLDLYYQSQMQRSVSVSSAVIASSCPATTGLRWVHVICDSGLAQIVPDPSDKRRRFVELTSEGQNFIVACLKAFPKFAHNY
ncbi:winged helix-turn-helix transcriptional regulator [Erythrobacter sp. SCSIO 43205]|uniref:MarR family winged helix-turn-helix transcriptional regulator n=1 Tax=Erythrobacter sp. SCSIO 43205 TaxID=2779361 RepID=UPI001CA80DE0|nr:MarR family winged helix-turn-helix transcriptional regulator [Erythrobacter sp. SCSIO 43205]UAB78928.1 winged helix-turn-helix transcriptional regulator [Erythrobacter sp. SCSIO 43205]